MITIIEFTSTKKKNYGDSGERVDSRETIGEG